ncbi:hypothetical protein [Desulfosporosinus hippei]|uniref:hypothetical protein n=1 Tax=Desulfosporosinus hippei TaxID=569859 RepID=UPI000AA63A0C
MKILAAPIEALAWFENGKPHPLRFKLDGKELKINKSSHDDRRKTFWQPDDPFPLSV